MYRSLPFPGPYLWPALHHHRSPIYLLLGVLAGLVRAAQHRARLLLRSDAGTSTAEYAIATLAAAAMAMVLYALATSTSITDAIGTMVKRALHVDF